MLCTRRGCDDDVAVDNVAVDDDDEEEDDVDDDGDKEFIISDV